MPAMTGGRRFIAGLATIGVATMLLTATAQQPPVNAPPPTPPNAGGDQPQLPTFRTGANIVRVDVTVLDHRGNPVPTLNAEDFRIEEDGVPQKVTSLKFIEANGLQAADDDTSLTIRSPEHAAAEAARDDVRVFLIFWDEYSIDQFASALRAKDALYRLVTTAFKPTDLVALMDQLTPTDAIRFTRNFNDLSLDVKKLQGRLGVYIPTRSAVEDAQMSKGGDVRRLRAEVTVSALKSAVVFLGTLREGRKTVIFVSEGIRGLGSDATQQLADTVRAANESNTAIYTVDPRGLSARAASDSLYMLADSTGGRTIANTNGIEVAMGQVVKESSAYYLLGYSSVKNPADGKFHEIKVRVEKPGLDVRARHGYWAPSAKAIDDARTAAAAATPPTPVATALTALTTVSSRHVLDLWAGVERGRDGRPALSVAWRPRAESASDAAAATKVAVTATAAAQVFQFEGTVDERGPRWSIEPGAVKVAISVRDSEDRVIDSETRVVQVPAMTGTSLVWGSPVLLRGRTPREIRALADDPDAAPFAGHEFTRADRLLVRTPLFGDAAEATITARLTGRQGQRLVALPVAPLAGREGSYQVDLPLSSVAPGDYVIAVEASKGGESAEAFVAIRVSG